MVLTLIAFCGHIGKGKRCGWAVYLAVNPGDMIPTEFWCDKHKPKKREMDR